MKTILYPDKTIRESLCKRPDINNPALKDIVRNILNKVKAEGDNALRYFTREFDGITVSEFKVTLNELNDSKNSVTAELKRAINTASENIERFHRSQLKKEKVVETAHGVKCWRKNVPIENAGIYIPGGSAPLFSTVLMLAIPARIACCKRIIMCTPPDKNNLVNPLILYAALTSGVTEIYKIGGAQAIAAMAYGTETVPGVDKIFGPGNLYVSIAKEILQSDGVAIDIPAGPSEVLIIADKTAEPEFIAADLLSQAEHGPDSQVVLTSDNRELMAKVMVEIKRQLSLLPRKEIAEKALNNSFAILLNNIDECINFSNMYSPEHLIINTKNAMAYAEKVINAGSVFIGKYSCESAGDYASGTNHTLPTNGNAKSHSGVSVDSFIKKITFQRLTYEGIQNIGHTVELMAEAENLSGHKNAVSVRLISKK